MRLPSRVCAGPDIAVRRRQGFTLIEITIVLAVLAILIGIAQGGFRQQLMKARRSEAIVGLEGIDIAQRAFHVNNGFYGDTFDEIGFVMDGGTRVDSRTIQGTIYTFAVKAVPLDGDPRGNFQALATGDLDPGDGVLDILTIENFLVPLP